MRLQVFAFSLLALLTSVSAVRADAKNPTFDDDVAAIFKQHCTNCHGNDKQKSDLNLASYAALQQGGAGGAVLVPGDVSKSRLYTLSAHLEEPKMPPKGDKIPEAQLSLLKLWIEQGGRQNAGSKAIVLKPKVEIGLKSIVKGRPEGPPPMPSLGKLRQEPVLTARRSNAVLGLAASPWAPLLALGGQKQVLLYNSDSGQLLGVLPFEHGQINDIKFSRNGRLLLVAGGVGGQSGKAVLFNVETGQKIIEVGIESDAILAADISADQTQIAVGSPSKLIRIYSTTDGSVLQTIKKHTDWVTAVEFSPDGVLLSTGDRNGGLFVWEAFTGREYFSLRGHKAMITDISWRDDSNIVASSSEDGTVHLWEMENGKDFKKWTAHNGGASSVRFSHDGKLASTGRDRVTKLWEQGGKLLKSFEAFPDLGLRVTITHDNSRIIAGDWSGLVKSWNAADAKALTTFDINPLPLADRIKAAEAALASFTTKQQQAQAAFDRETTRVKQSTDAYNAAVAKANKIKTDLEANRKLVAEQTVAANALKPKVAAAKTEQDKHATATTSATNKAAAIEKLIAAKTPTAKALTEQAAKTPGKPELAIAAKKANDEIAALNAQLAAAKKAVGDAAAAQKVATDLHTRLSTDYAAAQTKIAEANKQVATLAPMLKPANDAIAPAKAAVDAANKAVPPVKTALDAARSDTDKAKAVLALLKPKP